MSRKVWFFLGAIGLAGLGLAAAHDASAKYEEPQFELVSRDENIEVREYKERLVAEVQVSGTGDAAANEAFRILAGYIFGKNVSQSKISMTAPVVETISSEKIPMTTPVTTSFRNGSMNMRFFMPSAYTLESLPEPSDKRISFSKLKAQRFAVIQFSGASSSSNMAKHEDVLRKYIESHGLNALGSPQRAVYNPPWTLPFLRKNEVWIPIENPD